MFRENETSRVAAVLEAKLAGDSEAAIKAATHYWLATHEDEPLGDDRGTEVWQALEELGATEAATVRGIALARRERIHPNAFIDIVERTRDVEILLELTGIALDREWPAERYAAATFDRLIRLKEEKALKKLIEQRAESLRAARGTWILVGFTMMTSTIGDRYEIGKWLKGWDDRDDVPMWLIAAYIGNILGHGGDNTTRLIEIARTALERTRPDTTAPLLESYARLGELQDGRFDDFVANAASTEELRAQYEAPILEHPIVAYANGAKRARPIIGDDFAFTREDFETVAHAIGAGVATSLGRGAPSRPPDWMLVELIQDMMSPAYWHTEVMPHFVEMISIERGDPRALELCAAMARSQPRQVPTLLPVWAKLVRKRVGVLGRIKLALF